MQTSLTDRLAKIGLSLSDEQAAQFERYRDLIVQWNDKIDITAIVNDKEIDEKHFVDSLTIFRQIDCPSHATVVDIGTGGGFPGIPMKIYDPSIQLTLVDSLQKRIHFLDQVVEDLELDGVESYHARAEEIFRQKKHRQQYDLAVSRAVAALPTLVEYCLPAVKVGGLFIAMKGPAGMEELEKSYNAIDKLGGKLATIDQFNFGEDNYERILIVIEKVKNTPKSYPRGQGKPRKNPL